jgi:hypothetical protein
MPTCRRTCAARDLANAAEACAACACPASPTVIAIAACRERFVREGGTLQGAAATAAQPDPSAFEVPGRPRPFALSGAWPGARALLEALLRR